MKRTRTPAAAIDEVAEPLVIRQMKNREVAEKRRRRNRLKRAVHFTIFLAAVGAVAALLISGHTLLITAEEFSTNVVKVSGNRYATGDELVALAGGSHLGNIFTLDLDAVRARLLTHGWVKEASVARIFPRTIEVRVIERTPVAVGVLESGPWLVDASGARIAPFAPGAFDLPFITGIAGEESAEELDIGLRALESLTAAEPGNAQKISEINCEGLSARVTFQDGTPALILGSERFVERLAYYRKLEKDLQGRFARIDYVDLRFAPRVYIKGDFGMAEQSTETQPGKA